MNAEQPNEPPAKLAQLAAQSFEAIYHKLAPAMSRRRDEAISAWLEGHETDAVNISRELLTEVAAHPDTPAHVRPIFELLTAPEHQTQAVLVVMGVYTIVSSFVSAAVAPFVTDISQQAWSRHPFLALSPAEAALADIRNAPTSLDLAGEAQQSGVDSTHYEVLKHITGEPPGLMQMLEMWRRKIIGRDDLHKGVLQSRIRDEWFDAIEQLKFAPPSPMEAITGAVKGHLDKEEARALAMEGGLAPLHFDWLFDTAGRPPGVEAMLHLLNRGKIDEGQFADAVRQSDIQNRWIPQLLEMRRYLPPPRTIVSMLRHGAISDDRARTLLEWHGVFPEDVDVFLAEGHAAKTEHVKHLAQGEVSKLYQARMISHAAAVLDLKVLGYDDGEATMILALVDSARERAYLEAGIRRVHSLFVAHHITISEASVDLDRLKVEAGERDQLLNLWKLEAQSNVKVLTLAQVQGAWRRTTMSTGEATARLVELGYHRSDVPHLLALAIAPTHFKQRTPADLP